MSSASPTPTPDRIARAGTYLTFFLAAEEDGVEILKVHEIIGMLPVTRVPRTPPFVRGAQMGVVVDKVSEVRPIVEADIEPTPSFGVDDCTEFLLGLSRSDGRVRLLLDIDRVLATSEVDSVQSASGLDG